ncbi:dolichyl-phosphate beta-glucosyltransferase [Streptomyces sp. NPDC006512]|uniref:dolichyl-phosphate beta-glucosyltransferase n=1 Tax=Streptomyces sp. NPDC006512 TaxID=3154307 RepID=UPI0033A9CBF6
MQNGTLGARGVTTATRPTDRGPGSVGLSVVIPAYREEDRLAPTLEVVRKYLDAHVGGGSGDWEVLVVDDGSPDRTAAIALEAGEDEPRIRLVQSEQNRGKGSALRLGVAASLGRRVLIMDADLATPIEELAKLERALADDRGAGAAIGSRAHRDSAIERQQSVLREVLGWVGNRVIRMVAVRGIRDTQCGFKLFDGDQARAAFGAARLDGWAIDVEILQYYRRKGWPVAEVPVRWAHQDGSKVQLLDYFRTLGELMRLNAGGIAVAALYVLASLYLYKGLWGDLDGAILAHSLQDQNQWEWFFGITADNISHLRNPLFTDFQNMPDGVNLMGNTVMLGLSVPLTPVTLLFGPTFTLALVFTLGIAVTAWAWYRLIHRRLTDSRWAAAAGGALAAFAPPMISHANAHPNFVVLFMIPVIIDRALRLCEGRNVVRDGLLLGLFSAYQVFLGEEPFLLAAMGMMVFAVAHGLYDRETARKAVKPLAKGLGIAMAVSVPLVAFPLYWQFFGPQSYHSVLHGENGAGNPLRALTEYSARSLFGNAETAGRLSLNTTEQNAFYGWPLLTLAAGITLWMWRRPLVRALGITALVMAVLSLGPHVEIDKFGFTIPGPWILLRHLPLLESVIESRVAMVCAPVFGMLLALALDRAAGFRAREHRVVGYMAAAAALIPVLPLPLVTEAREPVPAFITQGLYKDHLKDGRSLVPVPLPDPRYAAALRWQSNTGFGFKLAGGYFNGPDGPDRVGIYGAKPRMLSTLLRDMRWGAVPPPAVTPEMRDEARQDLAAWKAGLVVLPEKAERTAELSGTITALLGKEPKRVADCLIWQVGPE